MELTLNTKLFAQTIKSRRANKGLRAAAKDIGISFTTLSRIEQEKVPDVDTFIRICKWLNVSTDTFIIGSSKRTKELSNKEQIVAHLRAEKELNKDTINMLIKMIDIAYNNK